MEFTYAKPNSVVEMCGISKLFDSHVNKMLAENRYDRGLLIEHLDTLDTMLEEFEQLAKQIIEIGKVRTFTPDEQLDFNTIIATTFNLAAIKDKLKVEAIRLGARIDPIGLASTGNVTVH